MLETGSPDLPAPNLPAHDASGRPAIAILPFETLVSPDDRNASDESFFADGVAEEITAALSRMRSLIVIARSSTQRYRGQPVDLAQVARELGVRYVVLGSVRRAAGAVRINARLVEAATGTQIWASHYDGKLEDVFALEDRITGQVIAAIAPTIRSVEIERARRKRPDSMEAYDYIMRALAAGVGADPGGRRRGAAPDPAARSRWSRTMPWRTRSAPGAISGNSSTAGPPISKRPAPKACGWRAPPCGSTTRIRTCSPWSARRRRRWGATSIMPPR